MGTLLFVHAHPDDEAIATGGVMCMAREQGHRVVLVTCTRGEEGEINNMDEATTRPILAAVRTEELRKACEILDVSRQVFLDYRDSGMAGVDSNNNPTSFHMAPLAAAAERTAAIMREERPDVVVTSSADGTYGHPDHIKAYQTAMAAVELLLAREGTAPKKVYLHSIPREQMEAARERARQQAVAEGKEPDQTMANLIFGVPEAQITTYVDVKKFIGRKKAAFQAHVSQNNPNSPFATMSDEMFEMAFGTEAFELVRGELGSARPEGDLFAGI